MVTSIDRLIEYFKENTDRQLFFLAGTDTIVTITRYWDDIYYFRCKNQDEVHRETILEEDLREKLRILIKHNDGKFSQLRPGI